MLSLVGVIVILGLDYFIIRNADYTDYTDERG